MKGKWLAALCGGTMLLVSALSLGGVSSWVPSAAAAATGVRAVQAAQSAPKATPALKAQSGQVDLSGTAASPGEATKSQKFLKVNEAQEVKPSGAEVDLPGGHADPDGVNVDHQFQGEE